MPIAACIQNEHIHWPALTRQASNSSLEGHFKALQFILSYSQDLQMITGAFGMMIILVNMKLASEIPPLNSDIA